MLAELGLSLDLDEKQLPTVEIFIKMLELSSDKPCFPINLEDSFLERIIREIAMILQKTAADDVKKSE